MLFSVEELLICFLLRCYAAFEGTYIAKKEFTISTGICMKTFGIERPAVSILFGTLRFRLHLTLKESVFEHIEVSNSIAVIEVYCDG